ncbi:MAG: hypothetical protein H6R07_666 [Proteobacteria bacterium]|nr:hypothetical protein [Pseudomonadota bacterium]
MKWTLRKRLWLDGMMTVLILLEFAYQLTGNTLHELIGIALFLLFIGHAALNWRWFPALFKGRYNGIRLASLTVNLLLLADALLLMMSGLLNSNLLFAWFGVQSEWLPHEIHSASANGFLILMAVHLGLHWKMVMAETLPRHHPQQRWLTLLPILALALAAYGIYAMLERKLLLKLIAYYSFDHWDFEASIAGFFFQYIAIVGLYTALAHYGLRFALQRRKRER